jgi:glycerol-3-phosphate dehydrogenase subunit C
MKSHLPRQPIVPPAERPSDARYYDARDLEDELRRTFQVCHECRMCVNYCGSFPELFARVDRDVDAGKAYGAEALSEADFHAVGDECWQCKLCYIKCPYTKADDARELLDFPRLMLREKANRSKRSGVPLVDRLLGEPEIIGKLGAGKMAPVSQLIQASRLLRKVQQSVTGISADFPLPPLARTTAQQWWNDHEPPIGAGDAGEVALFATCYGNYNSPEVVRAAVAVLEHAGYRVTMVSDGCCGMPNLDGAA